MRDFHDEQPVWISLVEVELGRGVCHMSDAKTFWRRETAPPPPFDPGED